MDGGLWTLVRLLLSMVIRALTPALADEAADRFRDTSEDARPDAALTARLRRRVQEVRDAIESAARPMVCIAGLSAAVVLGGCGTRTVYIPDGMPVRLAAPVKGAQVWTLDADGKPRASTYTIPEGWYALPDPGAP